MPVTIGGPEIVFTARVPSEYLAEYREQAVGRDGTARDLLALVVPELAVGEFVEQVDDLRFSDLGDWPAAESWEGRTLQHQPPLVAVRSLLASKVGGSLASSHIRGASDLELARQSDETSGV